jgi:hypothetical protein
MTRHEVLLEERLHGVGCRLKHAEWPRAVGTDPALNRGAELPLGQDRIGDNGEQNRTTTRAFSC